MQRQPISAAGCIVRNTAGRKGRTIAVSPGSTAVRYLHYGRIILDPGQPPVRFENGGQETGLVCLDGSATVDTGNESHRLERLDALYIPRDSAIEVTPGNQGCDLAEIGAPVEARYPLQFVEYNQVKKNPGLHFSTGGPGTQRELNILLGKNIEAGRILAGVTFSAAGNWTSWPPHEHADLLEEAYLYIDMPAPGFGVQLVYTNPTEPELATIVREGDVVLMPEGYHPNVAAPGSQINFLWMMAAIRERESRQFGVVNVQPEYASGSSGLEKGRAEQR
jgi:5-deoxy-glucuronate isomerase